MIHPQPERAQLSVEPGHFYADTFAGDPSILTGKFKALGRFVDLLTSREGTTSVSFLFDDYHQRPDKKVNPTDILEQVRSSATEAGVRIDYIAREAACVKFASRLLDNLRPSGSVYDDQGGDVWLTNVSTTLPTRQAMHTAPPPRVSGDKIAIELFRQDYPKPWACPHLVSVWQCLRLGILEDPDFNAPPVMADQLPHWERWEDVPPLVQLNPDAAPFAAERSFSILPNGFVAVENAARTILDNMTGTMAIATEDQRIERLFLDI